TKSQPEDNKKITVITTLFPLYDFTRAIADNKADIILILPPGVEAHAFEPKPADIMKVDKADLFIYTGKYMEPWAQDILKSTASKKLTVADASLGINLVRLNPNHRDAEPEDGHGHGSYDPHIWLDFDNAMKIVDTITEGLCKADPGNSGIYRKNADVYKEKLAALDKEYKESLSGCKKKTLIHGGHFAFGYLARRYGLEYISAYEGSPNSEPTARKIIELKNKIKQNNIHFVFFEELLNPRVSEITAKEAGATLLKLNGAHNITKDEFRKGVTFLSLMENNLTNLKIGLECK
ncbi:MAG: ABC-type metal ion transport system, periplasmic component, partial [Deltaproteobacteria bacterium]|nr:ABC-type metal ion transport system, periplasmic component [Deltaproteobacteria bacterium]